MTNDAEETWEEIEVSNATVKYVNGNPVLVIGPDPYPQTDDNEHDNVLIVRLGQVEAVPADSVTDTAAPEGE